MKSRVDDIKKEKGSLNTICIPELEEMLAKPAEMYPYTKTWASAKNDKTFIVHTSGSTG